MNEGKAVIQIELPTAVKSVRHGVSLAFCPTCGVVITDKMYSLRSFTCENGHSWKRTDETP